MRRTTALVITALTVGGLVSCSEDEQTSSTTQDQTTAAVEDETTTADATEEGTTPMAVDDGVMEVDDAGVRYGVVVTPQDPSPDESWFGCIPAADAGQTNIRFAMTVGFRVTSATYQGSLAVPHMEFRLNLNDDGQSVDPKATTFDSARYTDIEARTDGQCDDMNSIGPDRVPSADPILVGEVLGFPLTAGPVSEPPPEGIVLYVRFFTSADGDVSDLAVRYDP